MPPYQFFIDSMLTNSFKTYNQWEQLPLDAIEDWTVQTVNALKSLPPH